jgi:formate dehydrogenase subunit beta
MEHNWMIETKGDPLRSLHSFIADVWQAAGLDFLYLPLKTDEAPYLQASLIDTPVQLAEFNPFTPVMSENLAKGLPAVLAAHPGARIGVFLRPCEMRALQNMADIGPVDLERLVTFCADCLGTFPLAEYEWRARRKGSRRELTEEAIQFSRQGGLVPYRYRSACQSCESPMADRADVNIGVLGLPIRKHITVMLTNGLGESVDFETITGGAAPAAVVRQRDEIVNKMVHRSRVFRQRVSQALDDVLPADIGELVEHFYQCGACTDCIDNCPICEMNAPRKGADGRYQPEDLASWVLSCVGCGMCEQACEQHTALHLIFARVGEALDAVET